MITQRDEISTVPIFRLAVRAGSKGKDVSLVLLAFECGTYDAALPNDLLKGSNPNLWVVWNGTVTVPRSLRRCMTMWLPRFCSAAARRNDELRFLVGWRAIVFLAGWL